MLTETVFAIPGMDRDEGSDLNHDYPVLRADHVALVFVIVNLIVDISMRPSTRGSG